MAKCLYCGQAVGLMRKQHPDCQARHDRAIAAIPGFFAKIMGSAIEPDQFGELLQGIANTCFIDPDELKPLCAGGLNGIIDDILRERPPTATELDRISRFVDAIETRFPIGLGLDETLVKAGIIAELYEGKVPSPITVVGPMPIDLASSELVLWVFNQIGLCRPLALDLESETVKSDQTIERDYVKLGELLHYRTPAKLVGRVVKGDMVVTDRNLHFLRSETARTRIPVAKVAAFQPYADGIHFICNPTKLSRTFLFPDPWFAANLVNGLLRRIRIRAPSPAKTT